MPPALEIQHGTAGYGTSPVLHKLDFQGDHGETIAITGANGAGKTTLFKVILGLIPMREGSMSIGGRRMEHKKDFKWAQKKIGFVPQGVQKGNLPITVFEYVMLGNWGKSFAYWKRPSIADKQKTTEWLEYVGLTELANQDCKDLSGGQQQRMNIARALIREPDILLLDEPSTHLDTFSRDLLYRLIDEYRQRAPQLLTLMITHQLEETEHLHDRICLMKDGTLTDVGGTA
ncbi:metal ABC transporter ATP-binding protein [Paenibacillus sp. FSL R5-0519]|uniref:metal ABC transporter ATP-binding protein n=1 Tax=Paenibacillus sp. FSL R5-0519 TaxID=2921648 RepID=UPI0030DD73F4